RVIAGVGGGEGGAHKRNQAWGKATERSGAHLCPGCGGGGGRCPGGADSRRCSGTRRQRRRRFPRCRDGPAWPAGTGGALRRRTRRRATARRGMAGEGEHAGRTGADASGSDPAMSDAATAGAPLRVVIADDQTLVRSGFRLILDEAGMTVVAEAANGKEAVAAVLQHRPDVALMDIRMPGMDGLEATRRILGSKPGCGCRIIILTTFDLDEYVYAALTAGASGFLLKATSPEQLVAAVRTVRS